MKSALIPILAAISLVCLSAVLINQYKISESSSEPFNLNTISHIELSNYCGPMDSCQQITHKLTDSMMKGVVHQLNSSESIGSGEFSCEFWLYVYHADGTRKSFISDGVHLCEIKENEDYPAYIFQMNTEDVCVKMRDAHFLNSLWEELDKSSNSH